MLTTFFQIIFTLCAIVCSAMAVPLIVALHLGEATVVAFIAPMLVSLAAFLIVHFVVKSLKKKALVKNKINLSTKQTYAIVASAWIISSIAGSAPLLISGAIPSFTDAVFESVSGFTTTGATILTDIESLPRSINMWRCMTHWLGGMGIVALTVALLPLLGVGGFSLIKAETTGPEKSKITSKITTTAKVLWLIYLVLTLLHVFLLKIAGMDTIDSVSHAFSSLGTGGFSTRNASIASFHSTSIDAICTLFMFLSGINFSLYFYIVQRRFSLVKKDTELRAYCLIVLVAITAITILTRGFYGSVGKALRYASFQVVSIITTTGYATCDYTEWPVAAQFFIFILFFIGGSSGSTGGGIKVIRHVIMLKCLSNETRHLIHPHGVYHVRLSGHVVNPDIISNVASFMALYFMLILATTFVGCVCNIDLFTSATAAVSMVGNVGPAFNKLSPSFTCASLPSVVKWWYAFAMVAGRLELYTVLIFFTSAFWKR